MKKQPRVKLPPLTKGYARAFRRCKQRGCGRVYYMDYVPYSIGGRFLDVPCGHSIGHRDWNLEDITETQYHRLRLKELIAASKKALAAQLDA